MDERERQAELREARAKAELDKNSELEVARKQGKAIGLEEGKAIGLEEGKIQTILRLNKNGFDAKTIASMLDYPLEFVTKVLEGK